MNSTQTQFLRNAVQAVYNSLMKLGHQANARKCEETAKQAVMAAIMSVQSAGTDPGQHNRANKAMIVAADQAARSRGAACKAGCSHCCKSEEISISVYEARTIKENFDGLSDATKQAVMANARSYKSTGLPSRKERSPCVFLVDEKCSIHEFRPSMCWAYLSLNERLCAARLLNGQGAVLTVEYAHALYVAFNFCYLPVTSGDAKLRGCQFEMNSTMRFLLCEGGQVEDLPPGDGQKSAKVIPINLLN